jgi:hypothetical protein
MFADAAARKPAPEEERHRELLKQLSALQAQTPAPADLQGQTERINTERARLPEQRAEFVRARLGTGTRVRLETGRSLYQPSSQEN